MLVLLSGNLLNMARLVPADSDSETPPSQAGLVDVVCSIQSVFQTCMQLRL
jgi:hypothetical protein